MSLNKTCCTGNCNQGRDCFSPRLQHANGGQTISMVGARPGRSCDELGVCQNTPICPKHASCSQEKSPFYFAPGVINGGSTDLQPESNNWIIDFTWTDFAVGTVIVAIIMAISGWLL